MALLERFPHIVLLTLDMLFEGDDDVDSVSVNMGLRTLMIESPGPGSHNMRLSFIIALDIISSEYHSKS
jgi:hypothetical protein